MKVSHKQNPVDSVGQDWYLGSWVGVECSAHSYLELPGVAPAIMPADIWRPLCVFCVFCVTLSQITCYKVSLPPLDCKISLPVHSSTDVAWVAATHWLKLYYVQATVLCCTVLRCTHRCGQSKCEAELWFIIGNFSLWLAQMSQINQKEPLLNS